MVVVSTGFNDGWFVREVRTRTLALQISQSTSNSPDLTHTHTVRPSPRNTETQTYNTLDLNTNQTPTSKHLPWFTTCLSCHFFLPVLPSSTCANSLTNFSLWATGWATGWATRWASPTPVSGKKTTQESCDQTNQLLVTGFDKVEFYQTQLRTFLPVRTLFKCIDGDDWTFVGNDFKTLPISQRHRRSVRGRLVFYKQYRSPCMFLKSTYTLGECTGKILIHAQDP